MLFTQTRSLLCILGSPSHEFIIIVFSNEGAVLVAWLSIECCCCAFVFNVPPTAKVILTWGHSLKSHPTDWGSWESSLQPLVYKASGLSTTPQQLLLNVVNSVIGQLSN